MSKMRLVVAAILALLICCCDPIPVDVVGDEDDGTITGTVTRWGWNSPYVDDEYMEDPSILPIIAAPNLTVALDATSYADFHNVDVTTTTNATGQYVLTHVPIGLHTIFVGEAGRDEGDLRATTYSGLAYSVLVTKDAVTTANVFAFEEASYLFHCKVTADLVPVPNQTVNITMRCSSMSGLEMDPQYRTIETDASGEFSCIIHTWEVYEVTFDIPDSDTYYGGQQTFDEPFSGHDTAGMYHIIDFKLKMYPK